MNNQAPELTVKEQYQDCKGFECPRLLRLMKQREDGTPYFTEGDLAYYAMTLCNNWTIGLSDGNCPIKLIEPTESEEKAQV